MRLTSATSSTKTMYSSAYSLEKGAQPVNGGT